MKIPKILENEKSRITIVAVLMIVALSAVSLWQRNLPTPNRNAFNSDREMAAAAAQSDPVANEQIMKQIVDPQEIAKDIATGLDVNQDVSLVGIPDSKLRAQANTSENMNAYVNNLLGKLGDYNAQVQSASETKFDGTNATLFDKAYADTQDAIKAFYAMPVPKDAFEMHKDVINMLMANADLFVQDKLGLDNPDVMKRIYHDYAVLELASRDMFSEYANLKPKYNLP